MGFWRMLAVVSLLGGALFLTRLEAQDQQLHIEYDQGFLTVSLDKAELGKVLSVIAEKTGISVDSPENLNKSITIEFTRTPLDEGLYTILRDVDHVLIFSPSDEKDGKPMVSGVYIPSEQTTRKRTPTKTLSTPTRAQPELDSEEDLEEEEEMMGAVTESPSELEEDPILERYETELDRLEQEMELVEEDSPQGKAIMTRMRRLQGQIEKRLEQLESQEPQ
jgi:hypothetical protein